MWPMHVDYTEEECKKVLRSLELETYAALIDTFRAQGALTEEKKKTLQELCSVLSIPMERHKAEIRRAVNDEHLNTVAERLCGPNTSSSWVMEGRRAVPLMPRLSPETIFTAIADSAANAQAAKNANLPLPSETGIKENNENESYETMASRKRKDKPTDQIGVPQKFTAFDNSYFSKWCSFVTECVAEAEAVQVSHVSASVENPAPPDTLSKVAQSHIESNPFRTSSLVMPGLANSSPANKGQTKQMMLKPSSAISTFSNFDHLSVDTLPIRTVGSSLVTSSVSLEQAVLSDTSRNEMQNNTRLFISPSTKSPISTPGSTLVSSSSMLPEHFPVSKSSPASSKLLSQIKSKAPQVRQSLSSNPGLKISSHSNVVQQQAASSKSQPPNVKLKQDDTSSILLKKPALVFSSADSQTSPLTSPSAPANDTVYMQKPQLPFAKKGVTRSELQTTTEQLLPGAKLTTVAKSFQKTPVSQHASKAFFSSSSKPGLKSVILSVSSTSSTTSVSSAPKMAVSVQAEGAKLSTAQALPKSSVSNFTQSQIKLNTSSAQPIQYRNEGGMMRIVNITQPVGTRLPSTLSSSISALGLSTNLPSSALRVTLPAGTLSASSSVRVSSAAKPNVIVVHKAPWSRTPGAAVIVSSATALSKVPNEKVEAASSNQKLDKTKSAAKIMTGTISSKLPSSTSPVPLFKSVQTISSISTAATKSSDVSVQNDNTVAKATDKLIENQCKRNLGTSAIEESRILPSRSLQEKGDHNNQTEGDVLSITSEVQDNIGMSVAENEERYKEPAKVQIDGMCDVILLPSEEMSAMNSGNSNQRN